jgi:hypothetical protein
MATLTGQHGPLQLVMMMVSFVVVPDNPLPASVAMVMVMMMVVVVMVFPLAPPAVVGIVWGVEGFQSER